MKFIVLIVFSLVTQWAPVNGIGEGVLDLSALMGIFSGMANLFLDVNTTDISIDRLMGKWHQMYKAAINFDVFQTNLYCQVAYFRRNKVMGRDGFSIEEAFHVIAKNGPIEVYKRDVTRTGTGEFWMYTEEYFYPRQFYIVKVGPDDLNATAPYEYLIATDSNRLALMVFARDPLLFHQYYDKELQNFLTKQGFGGYVFWNQPVAIYQGSDCFYPSEQEVFTRRAVKGSQQKYPSSVAQQAASAFGTQQQQQLSAAQQQQLAIAAGQQQFVPGTGLLQAPALTPQQQAVLFNARQQAALQNAKQRPSAFSNQQQSPNLLNTLQNNLINLQQPPLSSLSLNPQLLAGQQGSAEQQQVIPIQSLSSLQQLQNLLPRSSRSQA